MKILVVAGVLVAFAAATSNAQTPKPGEGDDHSQELGNGLYSINWGTMGLNVGMSAGADGILLVDAQDEPAVARLQSEIAKRSDKPVRIVVNTHWHVDHVGANALYRRARRHHHRAGEHPHAPDDRAGEPARRARSGRSRLRSGRR